MSIQPENMNNSQENDEGYDIPHPLWDKQNRVNTFLDWHNHFISVDRLALAGFIYVGPKDKVKCVFCYLIIENWHLGEDPLQKHVDLKPDCPHIKFLLKEDRDSEVNLQVNSIYQNLSERRKTFEHWPPDHPITPDSLAAAGFFYTNDRDRVQCFSCKLFVEQWDPTDDPFIEHCRFSSNCQFMKMVKGNEFMQQCNPGASATAPSLPTDTNPDSNSRHLQFMVEAFSIQGFSKLFIECAFLQRKIKGESPFTNSESLFEAILKLPRADEASSARLRCPNQPSLAEIALFESCKICLEKKSEYSCKNCLLFSYCENCKNRFNNCPKCDQDILHHRIDTENLLQAFESLRL